MRLVISLLTAVCFIAAAEASGTSVATPQSQAAPSAPKSSTIDIIKQPSLLRQKLAGNCTTACQWGGYLFSPRLRPDCGGDLAASASWPPPPVVGERPQLPNMARKLYGLLPCVLEAGPAPPTADRRKTRQRTPQARFEVSARPPIVALCCCNAAPGSYSAGRSAGAQWAADGLRRSFRPGEATATDSFAAAAGPNGRSDSTPA